MFGKIGGNPTNIHTQKRSGRERKRKRKRESKEERERERERERACLVSVFLIFI